MKAYLLIQFGHDCGDCGYCFQDTVGLFLTKKEAEAFRDEQIAWHKAEGETWFHGYLIEEWEVGTGDCWPQEYVKVNW